MKLNIYRLFLAKMTGDALTENERTHFEIMGDVYEENGVHLKQYQFKKFKYYWKIDNKYNN